MAKGLGKNFTGGPVKITDVLLEKLVQRVFAAGEPDHGPLPSPFIGFIPKGVLRGVANEILYHRL
jgi:hypothetical protein